MKAICVDDERLIAEHIAALCRELPQLYGGVECFTSPEDALAWLARNEADVALLDIDMPDMNGIELAGRIKDRHPDMSIIFLTGYSEYALDAFRVHASGYLLKPVDKEALAEEIAYVLSGKKKEVTAHIFVKTFGRFDVFVDGREVHFKMAKCKELLAYLVDKQGASVARKEVFAAIWENRIYDRKMQKQLDVYIRRMRDTLREYGIGEIFELSRGILRIRPEHFTCDAYQFFLGDRDAVNSYHGEYMDSYPWASMTESLMFWKVVGMTEGKR